MLTCFSGATCIAVVLAQLQGYFMLNIVDVISVVLQVFVLVCMCVSSKHVQNVC